MRHTILMRHVVALAALLALPAVDAPAQEVQTIPVSQRTHDVFELSPASPVHISTVPVGSARQLLIDVTAKTGTVNVAITNPAGVAVDPAAIERFVVGSADAPPLGAVLFEVGEHHQASIATPAGGDWQVRITLPAGATGAYGSVTAIATGGFSVGATTSRPTYQAGEPVVVAMAAFDGAAAVAGATAGADVYAAGSELTPSPISLKDDGVDPDAQAGDGLYTAVVTGLAPGHYLVDAWLQAGTQRSVAATNFEIVSRLAVLTGAKTDSGVDANGDGLFDFVRVNVGVDVDTAATYEVLAALRGPGGREVQSSGRAALATGPGTVPVEFTAGDIRSVLAVDGPWEVRDVRLVRVSPDGLLADVLVSRNPDLGSTGPYTLAQLQRPVTLIVSGLTEEAVDTNANGLFDLLEVRFQIDTLRAGTYTWTGNLRAQDGTVLGVASGQRILAVGVTAVTFTFAGTPIGSSELDGPYQVTDVAAYGPPGAVAVLSALGSTRTYSAYQFEGAQVTFARLLDLVRNLVITGRGGIPRAHGIRQSLLQKALNAEALAEKGNATAARNLLDAFIHEVNAQVGEHIAPADGEQLTTLAGRLRDSL